MDITQLFSLLASKWEEVIKLFSQKYESLGRPILDFLHLVFQNTFNVVLVITVIMSLFFLIITIYMLINRKKEQEEIDAEFKPFVTVQIPTYNELVALRCAKACLELDYPKDKYEILIGDDSNKPEISKKFNEFAQLHENVKVIKRDKNIGFKPGNLNNMLNHSKGEYLVIFDSDFVPSRDFLTRIIQPFRKDENIAAVQSKWTFINQNQNLVSLLAATILNVYHYITLPFIKGIKNRSFLCGSAEAVKKDVLIKLGGWESGNLTEDIEYSIRLLNKGYKLIYLEDLTCDSEVPYKTQDLYRQQMRWAYGVIYSLKKHFKELVFSKSISLGEKACVGIVVGGYFLALTLFALFFFGILSVATHPPAPIDYERFFYELIRNIILTSGLLFASTVSLVKSRNAKKIIPMIASSFIYGLITTYYVNKGIFKAILGRPMHWYMLNKKGNENV